VRRLELALKSGNVDQAQLALESVRQSLSTNQGSSKLMAGAISELGNALTSGDFSKAREALAGIKEEVHRDEVRATPQVKPGTTSSEARRGKAVQEAVPALAGALSIKA
jgi:hypothetical protein